MNVLKNKKRLFFLNPFVGLLLPAAFIYTRPARIVIKCIARQLLGMIALCWILGAQSEELDTFPETHHFDISAMVVHEALDRVAKISGHHLFVSSELTENLTSNSVKGLYTVESALAVLLKGTGLSGRLTEHGVIIVRHSKAQYINEGDGMKFKKNLFAAAVGLFGSVGSQQLVFAEEVQASNAIEEIIVTATKRVSSLQDTAMAISALGSDTIDKRNLVGMSDYLSSLPGANVLDQGPGFNSIVIRGLSADPQLEGVTSSPVTGVYFGEVSIAGLGMQGNSADIKLVDIERIEVLKGPQGTLYGAGAMGGVVRNIPVQPNLEKVEGKLKVGFSNTAEGGGGNSALSGVINIPLIDDTLAIRAVIYRFDESGLYNNIAASDPLYSTNAAAISAVVIDNDDAGNNIVEGGRISILWKPTDKLMINANYLSQDIEQDGWGQEDIGLGEWTQRRFQVRNSNDRITNEGFEDDIKIANLIVEYDLDWATVFSSSAWVDEDASKNIDLGFFFGDAYPWGQQQDRPNSIVSEEIRLISEFDGSFQFLLGFYYEDKEVNVENFGFFGGTDPSLSSIFGSTPGETLIIHSSIEQSITQRSFFGELYYDFNEQFKLTVGGRAFEYDREDIFQNFPSGLAPSSSFQRLNGDDSDVSFKVGLEYSPNDSSLIYANWSEGFRLGHQAPPAFPFCDMNSDGLIDGSNISAETRTIDNDFVESHELGGKFSLLNNQLILNTAVYQNDWKGIPITEVFDFCDATVNAGKARSRGVELEVSYHWSESFLINFSSSYVDSELLTDVSGFGEKGNRLPGSPRYNASLGIEYHFSVGGYDSYVRSDYAYVGGFYNNLQELGNEAGNYGRLNVNVGFAVNQLNISIYGDNLTNQDSYTWIDAEAAIARGNRLRPRTIGLNASYNF